MPRKKKKPFNRLPNNFGSIKKLSGNRRKPYYVTGPVRNVEGVKIPGEKLGSAESWEEAYEILALYWAEEKGTSLSIREPKSKTQTFSDVYELFWKEKYELSLKKYSQSSQYSTRAAFKNCSRLHDKPFCSLTYQDLQDNLDLLANPIDPNSKKLKHASLELVKNLYNEMYKFALKNDMAEKNYAQYVEIRISDDDEHGEPLSQEELDFYWKHSSIPEIRTALIMCYSGWRISELADIEIDLDEMVFRGGMKTNAGKNRIVPIHPCILPLVRLYISEPINYPDVYRKRLYEALEGFDLLFYEKNGKTQKRTPHDFRHTFSWICDKYEVNFLSKQIMLGHALGADVTNKVYGHRDLEQLRSEINKIPNPCY